MSTGKLRPNAGAVRWMVWPGLTGPTGSDERYVASVHSPNRSGTLSTLHKRSGEACVTDAGHTLTITPGAYTGPLCHRRYVAKVAAFVTRNFAPCKSQGRIGTG